MNDKIIPISDNFRYNVELDCLDVDVFALKNANDWARLLLHGWAKLEKVSTRARTLWAFILHYQFYGLTHDKDRRKANGGSKYVNYEELLEIFDVIQRISVSEYHRTFDVAPVRPRTLAFATMILNGEGTLRRDTRHQSFDFQFPAHNAIMRSVLGDDEIVEVMSNIQSIYTDALVRDGRHTYSQTGRKTVKEEKATSDDACAEGNEEDVATVWVIYRASGGEAHIHSIHQSYEAEGVLMTFARAVGYDRIARIPTGLPVAEGIDIWERNLPKDGR